MKECDCQCVINDIKATAREGVTRELMAQISDKERQIAHLERLVELLKMDLDVARGEITFSGKA
jgi:hypothetical protein